MVMVTVGMLFKGKEPKREVTYVSPNVEKGWKVKSEGAQRALKNFDNKKGAIDYGRNVAKNAELGSL